MAYQLPQRLCVTDYLYFLYILVTFFTILRPALTSSVVEPRTWYHLAKRDSFNETRPFNAPGHALGLGFIPVPGQVI